MATKKKSEGFDLRDEEVDDPVVTIAPIKVEAPAPVKLVDQPKANVATNVLSDDMKSHLKFCLESLSDIARRSNNQDFRKKVKLAVPELSKLL